MSFDKLVVDAKQYFPDLQIKYKDQSWFMRLLGFLLFFNKGFMEHFTTTIGSTIYFPRESFVKNNERSAQVTLLHELVHMTDAKRINKFLFSFLYLAPLTFAPLAMLVAFLSWKIALLAVLVCLMPIPAYFRMKFEKRAYMVSMYCSRKLHAKDGMEIDVNHLANSYLDNFKGPNYYYMWVFDDLDAEFADAAGKVKANQYPYEDKELFEMIDVLILETN